MISLFIPCIIISLLIFKQLLITKNKTDIIILKILFFLQKILLISNIFNKNKIFNYIKTIYSIILILSSILFNEKHNILLILAIILVSILTTEYYGDCLFNFDNEYIDNEYIEYLVILICLYKLHKM